MVNRQLQEIKFHTSLCRAGVTLGGGGSQKTRSATDKESKVVMSPTFHEYPLTTCMFDTIK